MSSRWKPNVTVAAIVEKEIDGRPHFLLVEEETSEGLRLNNPAGHLDLGESPIEGVVREAMEETARVFTPKHFLGVYLSRYRHPLKGSDTTYMRLAFSGDVSEADPARRLDDGIVRTLWMSVQELEACRERHRSPLLLQCIHDHLSGRALPLDSLFAHASVWQPELGQ
jgi:8-oxo-dGTP pyrophosphatase MutT (NUDIX family)